MLDFRLLFGGIISALKPPYSEDILTWLKGNGTDTLKTDSWAKPDAENLVMSQGHCISLDGVSESGATATNHGTIVSYEGTATPSYNGSTLSFTAGTFYNVTFSDGTHFRISEGVGGYSYSDDGLHQIAWSGDLVGMWSERQDTYFANSTLGWYEFEGSEVKYPSGNIAPFVSVWRTTTASETITLPATGVNDFWIDWGDGSALERVTTASPSHVYAVADDYTISISGKCTRWYQNNAGDKLKIIRVENLGIVGWTLLDRAFYGCSNMESFVAGVTDTSNVTNMSYMMYGWYSMTSSPDLSSFDTSNVTSMDAMMYGWYSMTSSPDLSSFDTSNVTSMDAMMQGWSSMVSPPDISSFDTSNVTSMDAMMRD